MPLLCASENVQLSLAGVPRGSSDGCAAPYCKQRVTDRAVGRQDGEQPTE